MKHFRLISIIYLPIFFVYCSASKSDNAINEAINGDEIVKNGNSLLWKIEGENDHISYIYGTMHMINAEYYNFTTTLYEKVAQSESIIMEIDGMPNPVKTYNLMLLDSGSVHDYFDEKQLVDLLRFVDTKLGMSPQEFDATYGSMKPFLLLQAITQGYFEPDAKSYDLTIMSIAGEKKIPLIGLETIEQQLGFFDQVSKADMAEMIMTSVKDYDKEKKNTQKLMKLYAEEKVDKLIPLLNKSSVEFMKYEDLFLYDRNKAWIPSLTKQINEKDCFIAVGAAHLFGKNGVLDLLEKEGYTTTAISF